MPWFKVDDGFCVHPKTVGLDMSARGLWVTAGSWCAQQLTDGVITDRQIRAIGGTRKQAEKLVAAGLWSSDGAPLSERRFFFNDWRDFQPTRDDVLSKRQGDADRKREARAEKARRRENAEMSTRTAPGRPDGVRSTSVRAPSALPDPTRPDPTIKEEEVTTLRSPGIGEPPPFFESDFEDGGVPSDWSQSSDPRCRKHARVPADQVPACRGCAQAREWFEEQAELERAEARRVIDDCPWCDDRGIVSTRDSEGEVVALRCDHVEPPRTLPAPIVERQPVSVPNWREAIKAG